MMGHGFSPAKTINRAVSAENQCLHNRSLLLYFHNSSNIVDLCVQSRYRTSMKHNDASRKFAELGHDTRLAIFRLLVKAGPEGLAVSDIQKKLGVPGSTLSHHLSRLVNAGLMTQQRQGRVLRCEACFPALNDLVAYLMEECCAEGNICG